MTETQETDGEKQAAEEEQAGEEDAKGVGRRAEEEGRGRFGGGAGNGEGNNMETEEAADTGGESIASGEAQLPKLPQNV